MIGYGVSLTSPLKTYRNFEKYLLGLSILRNTDLDYQFLLLILWSMHISWDYNFLLIIKFPSLIAEAILETMKRLEFLLKIALGS